MAEKTEEIKEEKSAIEQLAEQLVAYEKASQALKLKILERIAAENDIKPSRIPAPLNITEIGGYFNLMMKLNEQEMLKQTLTSILGLPMQAPIKE